MLFGLTTGLDYPFRGDESHFIETIGYFGQDFGLSVWQDYPEVTGPLFYFLYAAWGKLAGFHPDALRTLSIIISFITVLLVYRLYRSVLGDIRYVLAGIAVLLLNPYLVGLSIHVFTDIPALMFLVMAVIAIRRHEPLLLFISTACALLIRQYSVFLVMAAAAWLVLPMQWREDGSRRELAALLAGCVPLLLMMLLWRGPSPPSGLAIWVLDEGVVYSFRYIPIYVTFMALYSLPLVIAAWRTVFRKTAVMAALPLSLSIFFFPLRASEVTIRQTGIETVGLAHGAVQRVLGTGIPGQLLLWLFCFLGFAVLAGLLRADTGVSSKNDGFGLLLTMATVSFILVMPFSYQVWEKYLLMTAPFISLRLLMCVKSDRLSSRCP